MKKICIMCGLPGVGKTTYVRQLIKEQKGSVIHISRDLIRFFLLDEKDEYFSKEDEVLKILKQKINEAMIVGFDYIYIDATHLTKKSREKTFNMFKGNINFSDYQVDVYYLYDNIEAILKRNDKRLGRAKVPSDAIKDMARKFQLPNMSVEPWIDNLFFIDAKGGFS